MNEKFRAIGLDTEDKITEFIDYIDDLEDTEEIKSDVYGFFEEESSYNENHIPAYVVMTKYKGKYIVWVEDQCCDFAISYPPYNLCDIFSTYDEANEYYKSLAHSGIKPLSEQVEECKSQLIDEVDLRVSTMVPNVLNIKVWYKNCLIIEHLTKFDVQYINNAITMFNDFCEERDINICKIYKNRNNLNYQREYVVECQKKNEDAIHIYHIHIPSVYQGRVRCAIDLLNNAKVVESGCVIPSSNCQIYYSIRKGRTNKCTELLNITISKNATDSLVQVMGRSISFISAV